MDKSKEKQKMNDRFIGFLWLLTIVVSMQLVSCTNHKVETVERAFYYWKGYPYLSSKEVGVCDTLGVLKIYSKFFEVNFNQERGSFPEAKTSWGERYLQVGRFKEVVPTVYLRNIVFLKSTKEELDILADNVNFLITKYRSEKFNSTTIIQEFQMDCDWTMKSKDNYFYFLKKLKAISGKQISCTLRLYPYKYPDKMGVPPVDKVTLMCYNLLNPLENPGKNSILDLNELSSYLNGAEKYPLHLDFALPIYSWAQVYHNERFSEVLYTNNQILKTLLKQEKPLWYTVMRDTLINETYLRNGDQLKFEEIDAEKIRGAIALLKKHISFDHTTTITLFHLDEEQLNQFTNAELSSFYSDFSK
ncbi:MAG: hypothetical protein HOP30_07395 [Cyclobacteriaceae bacterium]|nr:hypothetical protein [Cyclobacteriaceae bacterium]